MRNVSRQRPGFAAMVGALCACLALAGCTQRPTWTSDPEAATYDFWLDRPAVVRVEARDYARLWQAAEGAHRRFGFERSTSDYRGGLLTTEPRDGGQFFEPWRDELRTPPAVLESSLASVRRRVRFDFGQTDDGRFWVEPRVVVERLASGERRLTEAGDFTRALGAGRQHRQSAEGKARYGWYPTGRDHALERSLANRIAGRSAGQMVEL